MTLIYNLGKFVFYFIFSSLFINSVSIANEKKLNILLIIGDDIGVEVFPEYQIGKIKAYLPNLQNLMKQGIRFSNFWTYPTCTPTRSSIITGKFGFHTNVLKVNDKLSLNETSLQKLIRQSTNNLYSDAVIGKWHLSKNPKHPNKLGVNYYAGLLTGSVSSYNDWPLTIQGVTSQNKNYITTKLTDLAIGWIKKQKKPWFLWLAYTAPHRPFHIPPANLYIENSISGNIKKNTRSKYLAMLQSMDTEIGRLLSSIPKKELENTVILFIGDNGTPKKVISGYKKSHGKGSIYQGGINTPFIVSGKMIKRKNEVDDSLVNSTDLFATILNLAGTKITQIYDSKSLVHLFDSSSKNHREFAYSEVSNKKISGYTIRDKRYKYIKYSDGKEELYDLINDPMEKENLKFSNMTKINFDKLRFYYLNIIKKIRSKSNMKVNYQ